MRTFLVLIMSVSSFAFGQDIWNVSSAQNASTSNSPVAVLQGCSRALGQPPAALGLVATGTRISTPTGANTSLTIKSLGALVMRIEESSTDGDHVRIVANGKGVHRHGGHTDSLPFAVTRHFRLDHIPLFLCEYRSAAWQATLVGTEQVGDATAYHIAMSYPGNTKGAESIERLVSTVDLYIDRTTLLPLKTKTLAFSPDGIQNHSEWETYYADYRDVQGLKIAFHASQYLGGRKVSELLFDSISVQTLSSTDFQ